MPNTDATTEWVTKIKALGAVDKATKLVAALITAWEAAYLADPTRTYDITTVYRDKV